MAETSKPEEDKIESHLGVIDYFYPAVDNIDSEIEIYRDVTLIMELEQFLGSLRGVRWR